ncbi:hypothetical protein V5O48_019586, partial [Marasmius crinis-equi]
NLGPPFPPHYISLLEAKNEPRSSGTPQLRSKPLSYPNNTSASRRVRSTQLLKKTRRPDFTEKQAKLCLSDLDE